MELYKKKSFLDVIRGHLQSISVAQKYIRNGKNVFTIYQIYNSTTGSLADHETFSYHGSMSQVTDAYPNNPE